MRIGLICPYSLTVPGGVQGQVLDLGRALRAAGHDVRVLGPCDGPPPEPGVTPLGNSIPTAANGSIAPIAPDVSAQLRVIRALRDERFDVVNLHEPLAPGPTLTTMVLGSVPLVGTFHAAGTSKAYRWLRPAARTFARRLDVRCAVSEDAREMAATALGGRYEMVYNGIEVERFAKATPTTTTAPTILFCGRHEPRKGLRELLEAHALLPAGTHLWVAGAGPETDLLRREYGSNNDISWLGVISDDEKLERLRGADVFCAPSLRGESFGVVLLEAMAAGTPVVASDLPGYARVARRGLDALLVAPGDVDGLADALRRVLSSGVLREALVDSGSERATDFAMSGLAERYIEIYGDAIERHRRADLTR